MTRTPHLCIASMSVLMLLSSALSWAAQPTVTLHSKVTGSKEQPRVMYLVPWQQPGEAGFDYSMQRNFADELFVPIDRDEFRRGLEYQALLDKPPATDAGSPAIDSEVEQ